MREMFTYRIVVSAVVLCVSMLDAGRTKEARHSHTSDVLQGKALIKNKVDTTGGEVFKQQPQRRSARLQGRNPECGLLSDISVAYDVDISKTNGRMAAKCVKKSSLYDSYKNSQESHQRLLSSIARMKECELNVLYNTCQSYINYCDALHIQLHGIERALYEKCKDFIQKKSDVDDRENGYKLIADINKWKASSSCVF